MMDGLATETMVASTRIMKNPTSIAHNACHGFAVARSSCCGLRVWSITSTSWLAIQPTLRMVADPDQISRIVPVQTSGRLGDGVADDPVLCIFLSHVLRLGRRRAGR